MWHTRDGHSDTVYGPLKVFIPGGWDYTQVFRNLGVTLGVQNIEFLKEETTSWHLIQQLW